MPQKVGQETSINFESRNPTTGELLRTYPEHDKAEIGNQSASSPPPEAAVLSPDQREAAVREIVVFIDGHTKAAAARPPGPDRSESSLCSVA